MGRLLFTICLLLPIFSFSQDLPKLSPETIKGEIVSIETYKLANRPSPHTQVVVRTEKGDIIVELGPEWYLKKKGIFLIPMDEIEVSGSIDEVNGKWVMRASKVKTNYHEVKID